ncbi:MAG: TonB family protein [Gammaproteobacteria bacterium]|nr:TonB family protein [Gammaproteobacteria bacterium]
MSVSAVSPNRFETFYRYDAPAEKSPERLAMMICAAIAIHAMFILGVTFAPVPKPSKQTHTLDVILVQSKTEEAPDKPDLLAQANQDGGGNSTKTARPATPLPSPLRGTEAAIITSATRPTSSAGPVEDAASSVPAETAPAPVLSQMTTDVTEQVKYNPPTPKPRPRLLAQTNPDERQERETQAAELKPVVDAALLSARSLAFASLSAEVDRKLQAYASRPRKKWITARTRESKYAPYMDAWRSKVERVGNLNYPDSARRDRLSGNLLLDVAIKADGTIEDVIIRRSSGHKILDDAAVRIVRLAGPFDPFPADMRAETDVLHIERTWQFLSTYELSTR